MQISILPVTSVKKIVIHKKLGMNAPNANMAADLLLFIIIIYYYLLLFIIIIIILYVCELASLASF